jgi:NAD(P)-dependent dehydrogenase (short-subunit alcohol dehydrogenase family)
MSVSGTAVVVGGASGIGAALADRYRERGEPVLVWDIAGKPDVECDVADAASVDRALAQTLELVGLPGPVTVTAGIGHAAMLLDLSAEEFEHVLTVNTVGPWLVMRAMAKAMIEAAAPGSFVATSSVSAHLVDRSMGAYCASKAALSMLVKVAASEWAPHNLRVNAVGPGVTMTPMLGEAVTGHGWWSSVEGRTPLGRLGQAGDIAQAILGLHELEWVTGQVLDVDGGLSLHSPIDAYGENLRRTAASGTE